MSNFFYPRMALSNIRKNKNIYVPYLLASALIVGLFYILSSIGIMTAETDMEGGSTAAALIEMSTGICGFFAIVIIFYINSFVVKRRKKEFGLYNVLGMEKRHIAKIMSFEVLFSGLSSIILGIIFGALSSQLLFLLLLKLIKIPAPLTFQIPLDSIISTAILFGIIFFVVLCYDIIATIKSNPIELLHATTSGEKEPKANWLLAILGAIALGGGYALALSVKTPSDAVSVFLLAVLLVVVGTYLLFIAGSITFLKILRKNKNFYYKSKNFISVSGMIYRMKQNAVGLASICILATAVLVTLSSTVCLFIGEEEILQSKFPRQVITNSLVEDDKPEQLSAAAKSHAQKYGLTIKNETFFTMQSQACERNNDTFSGEQIAENDTNLYYNVTVVTLEDYNRITSSTRYLNDNQALVAFNTKDSLQSNTVTFNKSFEVADIIQYPEFLEAQSFMPAIALIVPTMEGLGGTIAKAEDAVSSINTTYNYNFDVEGDSAKLPAFYETMRDSFNETVPRLAEIRNIDDSRTEFYQMYGGLLFIGIFFVILFLIVTVLIIYYKQITEGYDDHERFQIMHKVGMSDNEIKSTIQKQILMVFFLPIAVAVVHIAVAFPVLCKVLLVFEMTNKLLFLLCVASSVIIFTAIYLLVYQLTAKVYYKIAIQK